MASRSSAVVVRLLLLAALVAGVCEGALLDSSVLMRTAVQQRIYQRASKVGCSRAPIALVFSQATRTKTSFTFAVLCSVTKSAAGQPASEKAGKATRIHGRQNNQDRSGSSGTYRKGKTRVF